MITEDHTDTGTARPQEVASTGALGPEKICPSPCSSSSPSPSPSAPKSSTESSVTATSSSGDEGEGNNFLRNGLEGNTRDVVLTPPATDLECLNDPAASKPLRYNGRLEFYKEGVLCLELSHCEEGQGRRWLKTKGKSDIRQVVRVSKEVSIPCSPSPPNQMMINHPPNGLSSSTLPDNLSDEGSSAASSSGSPKSRDKSWRKQPVPRKCISKSLQFYMNPSPCIHGLLIARKRPLTITELTPRRPYALPPLSQWIKNSNFDDTCSCGKPRRRNYPPTNKKRTSISSRVERKSVDSIVSKLKSIDTKSSLNHKSKPHRSPRTTPHKLQRQYSASSGTSASSRKRPSKEIDDSSESRFTKKSPIKNLERTILSVPGIGNSPLVASGNAKIRSYDATDGKIEDSPPAYDHKKYAKSHAGRASPYSLLRPTSDPLNTKSLSNDSSPLHDREREHTETEDSGQETEELQLTPEEQQQYAMSRAISYTITSLLSQGSPSPLSQGDKRMTGSGVEAFAHAPPPYGNQALKQGGCFGLEEDKKSFLRHLLDTSDPIPTSTSHSSLPLPAPLKSKAMNQSPDKSPQKSRNVSNKGKRNSKVPLVDNSIDKHKGRGIGNRIAGNGGGSSLDSKGGILSHPPPFVGTATPPNATLTPPHHPPSPYGVPSPSQLESVTAAAMQYACHLIPHPPRAGKVAFGNPAISRIQIQPPIAPYHGDETPINLSQKDGNWPEAERSSPNDRASRLQLEGRAFPLVPHENLNEESDPDLPLNLCKKRRDD